MSKIFVTAKAQGQFIIDPQSRQPVGREQREVNKVFDGADSLDAVRDWVAQHNVNVCSLLFETAEPAQPEAQP